MCLFKVFPQRLGCGWEQVTGTPHGGPWVECTDLYSCKSQQLTVKHSSSNVCWNLAHDMGRHTCTALIWLWEKEEWQLRKKNLCKLWHQDYHDAVYKYIAGAVNTCCTMCKSAGRAGRLPLELVYGLWIIKSSERSWRLINPPQTKIGNNIQVVCSMKPQ